MTFAKIAAVVFLGVFITKPASAVPEAGKTAPDFSATDSNGKTVKLSDYKGKAIVLEWTNNECPYVAKHYSSNNMQKLQKEATAKGVIWLSVISSAPGNEGYVTGPRANELTKARSAAPTAVLLDPEGTLGKLYDARTTPHMFVIDKDGKLAYMGGIDDKASYNPEDIAQSRNYVRAAIDDIAAGKPVATPVSRPYGCSVKYKS